MLFLIKTLFVIDALMLIGLLLFRSALAPRYRGIVSAKIVLLALFTPIVALFCGNIYLFYAYLTAVVAFSSRSRAELAGVYVFLLPLIPYLSVEVRVGDLYLFGFSAVVAMNIGLIVGLFTTKGNGPPTVNTYDLSIIILVGLFVFISSHDTGASNILRECVVNIIGIGAPYLLISRSIRTPDHFDKLLLYLSLGATITAITAFFQALKHWVLFQTYYERLHVAFPLSSWTLALRAGLLRTGGSMLDYSAAGLFIAVALTVVPLIRGSFKNIGFWAVIVILVSGLLVTQSRGAWVAAIGGFLFVLAYKRRWARLVVFTAISLMSYGVIQIFVKSGPLISLTGKSEDASSTISYRKQLLSEGLMQIKEHPLFGQSPKQLVANLPNLVQGEHIVDFVNAHLFIAMASGIPLFVIWCAIWLIPIVQGWRMRCVPGSLMEAPAAIIVPAMIALIFTSIIDRNLTWPTIALALASSCTIIGRQRYPMRN